MCQSLQGVEVEHYTEPSDVLTLSKIDILRTESRTALCFTGCEKKQVFVESLMVYNQDELVTDDG